MNIRTRLIRATVATALGAVAFAVVHTPPALSTHTAVSMSLDARAPLHATLLPVVSVFADARYPDAVVTMRIVATDPLPVTLLPTVHVGTRVTNLPATPTIVAAMTPSSGETRSVVEGAGTRAHVELAPMKLADAAPALRTRMLPQ